MSTLGDLEIQVQRESQRQRGWTTRPKVLAGRGAVRHYCYGPPGDPEPAPELVA